MTGWRTNVYPLMQRYLYQTPTMRPCKLNMCPQIPGLEVRRGVDRAGMMLLQVRPKRAMSPTDAAGLFPAGLSIHQIVILIIVLLLFPPYPPGDYSKRSE